MERTLVRIGIDIGGTFTDFVIYDSSTGRFDTFKLLSTPGNPAEVVIDGINQVIQSRSEVGDQFDLEIIHGSTVATNALIERKGAKAALITTKGFRDVLQIGRQNRPELYNLLPRSLPPLIPQELRLEADERVDHAGNVLIPLREEDIEQLMAHLHSQEITSVAVCFLFSYLYPDHEKLVSEKLKPAGVYVSISCEVLPEFREYERSSTTAVNAYVTPVLDRYLTDLNKKISLITIPTTFRVMQSNGGSISLDEARNQGVRCVLSGPAGGIVGAMFSANLAQSGVPGEQRVEPSQLRIITFDMGGTSTDVSLIDNAPKVTTESIIGGCPIGIPVLDIHTIGAGGGSIAYKDIGGALRVGPESAGADPGPACYGRGSLPTVTDANLFLGRLLSERFLGGAMHLDAKSASNVITRLAEQLSMHPVKTALGIIAVINANMHRALRVISVERGYDPRDFELVSFGGAGGLHASDLARQLGVHSILIPPTASTLSAFGMLTSDIIKDYSQTVMFQGNIDQAIIKAALTHLEEAGKREVTNESVSVDSVLVERYLDVRYVGQSYELTIPDSDDFHSEFHNTHQATYGYMRPESPIEIVNIRVRIVGRIPQPEIARQPKNGRETTSKLLGHREVFLSTEVSIVPVYVGEALQLGDEIAGPAIIARSDTTILLKQGDCGTIDEYGNLRIEINE